MHPTHYGRICPIETPEGPNIGLISSLQHVCPDQRVRLHRDAVPQGAGRRGDGRDRVPHGARGGAVRHRAGQRRAGRAQPLRAGPRVGAEGRRVQDGLPGGAELHGRVAEAARVGGGGHGARSWRTTTPTAPSWARTCSARRCLSCSRRRPYVGTGMEHIVARDSGAVVLARRPGRGRVRLGESHRGARRDALQEGGPGAGPAAGHLQPDEVPPLEPEHLHQPAADREEG